jgi:cell division protein FtsL
MTIIGKLLNPNSRPRPTRKVKPSLFSTFSSSFSSAFSSKLSSALARIEGLLRRNQDFPLIFQKQWVTIFLAAMVMIVIVAGLSLNISARRAITGREIQSLQVDITTKERENADLQTEIAGLLSNTSMEQRAEAQGFTLVKETDLNYLVVPGFVPSTGVNMDTQAPKNDGSEMPAEYSESLFMWIARQLENASLPLANAR